MTPKGIRPEDLESLPLLDKIQWLDQYDPEMADAVDMLVTAALKRAFQEQFHAGACGGLRLKAEKKGGA
jgi:hypothetical protein